MIIPAVAACIHSPISECLLLAKRPPEGKYTDNRWEFPGGKIELGEAPEQALVREIQEELGCSIAPQKLLYASMNEYPDRDDFYLILFYECQLLSSEFQAPAWCIWVKPQDVCKYNPLPGAVLAAGYLEVGKKCLL